MARRSGSKALEDKRKKIRRKKKAITNWVTPPKPKEQNDA